MKSMKRVLATVIALTLLFSLSVVAHADEHSAANSIGDQIAFIAPRFNYFVQPNTDSTWYYAVTDLDHNGRLELLENTKPDGGLPQLKIWEIGPDGDSMVLCTMQTIPAPLGSDEQDHILDSMSINLLSNSCDTYYDVSSDTYYYLYNDTIETEGGSVVMNVNGVPAVQKVNGTIVSTAIGAASMKYGSMSRSVQLGNCISYSTGSGNLTVACHNGKQEEISAAEYMNLSTKVFGRLARSNTAFDWFTADEAVTLQRFVDSYAAFAGVLDMKSAASSAVPAATAVNAGGIYITKNPTDEYLQDSQTAEFIASTNIYDTVTWTFVSPGGRLFNEQEFVKTCGGVPAGTNTGDLLIKNVNTDMNGWGVYATFTYRGASVRSATAYFHVSKNYTPVTNTSTYYGVNGQTAVSEITPNPFEGVLAWICPVCGESTQNAVNCWNCGYHYGDPVSWQPSALQNTVYEAAMGAELRRCQSCGAMFNNDYDRCPYCGYEPNDGGWNYYLIQQNTNIEVEQGATLRQCQFCGEYFNADYDVCPYCHNAPYDGSYQSWSYYDVVQQNTDWEVDQGATLRQCQYCGEYFNADYDVCPYCHNAPNDGSYDSWNYNNIQQNTDWEVEQGATLRRCQFCGQYYNEDYDVCPYCHNAPNDGSYDSWNYNNIQQNTDWEVEQGATLRRCQFCGQYFNEDYDVCPYCHNAPID